MTTTGAIKLLPTDSEASISALAKLVLMPTAAGVERLAVAVVGTLADGRCFARPVATKVLRCLPPDLAHACVTFGSIVAMDFLAASRDMDALATWMPPLRGLELGPAFEVAGDDLNSIADRSVSDCALFAEASTDAVDKDHATVPRTNDESRFRDAVKEEVIRQRPRLAANFKRTFSLAGGSATADIDFVGNKYATCYAAINPKVRGGVRVTTASAALWRLARARDALGFAAPAQFELTAWVPPTDLPIYSATEYRLVDEIVEELRAQAKQEALDVVPMPAARSAAARLISIEATGDLNQ